MRKPYETFTFVSQFAAITTNLFCSNNKKADKTSLGKSISRQNESMFNTASYLINEYPPQNDST